MGKKFNKFELPHQWKNYYTKYPHGYTIYEALVDWINKVNDMVVNVNDWNDYLDDFVSRFDDNLANEVIKTLQEWQESGFLEIIINQALETRMDDLEEDLDNLNQTIINFKNLINTDFTNFKSQMESDIEDFKGEIENDFTEFTENMEYKLTRPVDSLFKDFLVFGHRGSDYAPENTKESIEIGGRYGLRAFEIDLTFTSDNKCVVSHDLTVDRLTNGTGAIKDMTENQFLNLEYNAGAFQHMFFEGVKPINLLTALKIIKSYDGAVYFDIKGTPTKTQLEVIYNTTLEMGLIGKAIFASFNRAIVSLIREIDPNIIVGLSTYNPSNSDIDFIANVGNGVVDFEVKTITSLANKITYARSNNVHLVGWTVDFYNKEEALDWDKTIEEKETLKYMIDNGVSGVISDHLLGHKLVKTSREYIVALGNNVPSRGIDFKVHYSNDLFYLNNETIEGSNTIFIKHHVPFNSVTHPVKDGRLEEFSRGSWNLPIRPFVSVRIWNSSNKSDVEGTSLLRINDSDVDRRGLKINLSYLNNIIPLSEFTGTIWLFIKVDGWQRMGY